MRAKSDINITPLIDIVLVLLIIFIVMVPSLAKVSNAVLPTLDGPRSPAATPLVVSLDGEGRLFLQRDAVPWAELPERLAPALMLQPFGARKVFLKVDGSLPHGYAVRAMDMIRAGSELARARTCRRDSSGGDDGGEAKVVMSLRKS